MSFKFFCGATAGLDTSVSGRKNTGHHVEIEFGRHRRVEEIRRVQCGDPIGERRIQVGRHIQRTGDHRRRRQRSAGQQRRLPNEPLTARPPSSAAKLSGSRCEVQRTVCTLLNSKIKYEEAQNKQTNKQTGELRGAPPPCCALPSRRPGGTATADVHTGGPPSPGRPSIQLQQPAAAVLGTA